MNWQFAKDSLFNDEYIKQIENAKKNDLKWSFEKDVDDKLD